MGVRKTVFASRAERENYEKLARQWGASYSVYPNLPFLAVFSLDDIRISPRNAERLKKTSIDFTLCDTGHRALVCIEFDGLYDGVNIGQDYFPSRDPRGKWRQRITKLKLAVAKASGVPFFVVGNEHFRDLSPEVKLTIVDGIIGDVLANRAKDERFGAGFDPEEIGHSHEDFENLSREEQSDIVQDWAMGVAVEAELTHNPIRRAEADLSCSLKIARWGCEYKHFPEVVAEPGTLERAKERCH